MCPIRMFLSKFYTQVFIENLDLSNNERLSNKFSFFIFRFFEKMNIYRMEEFKLEALKDYYRNRIEVKTK